MGGNEKTIFEKLKEKFLNIPLVAVFVFVAFSFISMGLFVDSIFKLKDNLEKLNPIEERKVQFDRVTHEHILTTAKLVDDFFLRIIEETDKNDTYDKYANDYRIVEVQLRNLLHREKSRPLNEASTKTVEKLLQLWTEAKKEHKKENSRNAAFGRAYDEELHKVFDQAIEIVLKIEASKIDTPPNKNN